MIRSEQMKLYQLIVPRESSYDVMNSLGVLDSVDFIDSEPNIPAMQRPFANIIKRCEEMLEKINYLLRWSVNLGIQIQDKIDYQLVQQYFQQLLQQSHKSPHLFLNELEVYINKKQQFIADQLKTQQQLIARKKSLIDQQVALVWARKWLGPMCFSGKSSNTFEIDEIQPLQDASPALGSGGSMFILQQSNRFTHLVGLIESLQFPIFQRIIFRITKNNFMIESQKLSNNDFEENQQNMTAFILLFPGSGTSPLWQKVKRICDACNVQKVQLPKNESDWDSTYNKFNSDIEETKNLLKLTNDLILSSYPSMNLNTPSQPSLLNIRLYLVKEMYLYHNINKMKMQQSIFIAKMWVRKGQVQIIQNTLNDLRLQSPNLPSAQLQQFYPEQDDPIHFQQPPTYFRTNNFLQVFQEIINTYGIPSYREINPTLFTLITFPFLFGIMFGDIGHGLCLIIFGLYLSKTKQFSPKSVQKIERQKRISQGIQLKNKIDDIQDTSNLQIIYDLRYLITLCGFFAFYSGFIYNEYFGFNLNLFGTCYHNQKKHCTYPIGLDPELASSLSYQNSIKMKLSIIIGYVQMSLGIVCFGLNSNFQKNHINTFIVFPSRLIFFNCTIGYMVLTIIIKWLKKWHNPNQAPNVISVLVSMWMDFGQIVNQNSFIFKKIQGENQVWKHSKQQEQFQKFLLFMAFISLIFMFIPPLIRDLLKLKYDRNYYAKKDNNVLIELQVVNPNDNNNNNNNNKSNDKKYNYEDQLQKPQEYDIIINKNAGSTQELYEQEHIGATSRIEQEIFQTHDHFSSKGDIIVHHFIETIEFVLGCVSNTASYLRLWALSLAHSELSSVFYELTLADGVAQGSIISLVVGLPIFIIATILVLLCMDAMECFLHSLRLHWVEFQSKFFKGNGYLFQAFSFSREMQQYQLRKQFNN